MQGEFIELFRAGEYPQGTFTEKDIDDIVQTYDPSFHEAPAVVGHPRDTAPAYGWVEKLKRVGDKLLGSFRQVAPEFAEAVKSGRYKKRSVRLGRNADGRWTLKHVGWLGAKAPEIKGLADVQFEQSDTDIDIDVDFQESPEGGDSMTNEEREKLLAKEREKIRSEVRAELQAEFAEKEKSVREQAKTELKEELKQELHADFSEKHTALEDQNRKLNASIRRRDISSRIDQLVAAGKVTPGMRDKGLEDFCMALDGNETEVEFSEGETTVKKKPLNLFFDMLDGMPNLVEFQELARKEDAARTGGLDENDKKIIEFAEKHDMTYRDAVIELSKRGEISNEED